MNDTFHIKGFIPTSFLDWPGTICSVIFLGGCGFRCPACHNRNLVLEPRSLPDYPVEEILRSLDARGNWIDGITVTGGEPTIHKSLPNLLRIFRHRKLKIKLDTNGSNPEMLEALIDLRLVDAVSMDIKAPLTSEEYSSGGRNANQSRSYHTKHRHFEILRPASYLSDNRNSRARGGTSVGTYQTCLGKCEALHCSGFPKY